MERLACSPGRAFVPIFLLAFAVRGLFLFSWMTPRQYIVPEFNSEIGRVARSLVQTGQYAEPYALPTGPTAHPLPLNTGWLALIYGVWGFTLTAGYVRCVLHIAIVAAMYAMLPWVAGRLGVGRPAGLIAGVVGALIPFQGLWDVIGWCSQEALAAILLGVLLAAWVRRWSGRSSVVGALLWGAGFGVSFHLAPALLLVMLGCLAFELAWQRDRRRWSAAALAVMGAALACVPWTWRNYAAFHELFFIRSNLGLELRLGNHDGAAADIEVLDQREGRSMRHPVINPEEARKVQEWGEMEYMRRARDEGVAWILAHPGEFMRLTASRFVHFWCGSLHRPGTAAATTALTVLALLGLRRVFPALSAPQRAAVLIPLVTFPLVYYLVCYMPRYRIPLDWMLLVLAGAEVWHWIARGRTGASEDL
jgi:hypothetical protein